MKRRKFITLLGGATMAPSLAARAQTAERVRRIGVWIGVGANDFQAQLRATAFLHGLRELGWIEGRNIRIDFRWDASDVNRGDVIAKELIGLALRR